MPRVAPHLLRLSLIGALACRPPAPASAPAPTPAPEPSTSPAAPAPAPWASATLPASAVPAIYVTEWAGADNRATCRLLAPAQLGNPVASARPRAANFGGGWGVAYDLPGERSAFGVAGTGASAWSGDVYDAWPERRTFADGSRVGYGPEGGGVGPNWLAYVRIPGQECLYNVWSRQGRAHLEELLAQLRFVTVN